MHMDKSNSYNCNQIQLGQIVDELVAFDIDSDHLGNFFDNDDLCSDIHSALRVVIIPFQSEFFWSPIDDFQELFPFATQELWVNSSAILPAIFT